MKLGQRKASVLSSITKRIVPIGRGPCGVEMRLFGKVHRWEIRRQLAIIVNSGEQSCDTKNFAVPALVLVPRCNDFSEICIYHTGRRADVSLFRCCDEGMVQHRKSDKNAWRDVINAVLFRLRESLQ
jgi:hypothetical protein